MRQTTSPACVSVGLSLRAGRWYYLRITAADHPAATERPSGATTKKGSLALAASVSMRRHACVSGGLSFVREIELFVHHCPRPPCSDGASIRSTCTACIIFHATPCMRICTSLASCWKSYHLCIHTSDNLAQADCPSGANKQREFLQSLHRYPCDAMHAYL
jgi:hypothetical protein